MAHATRRDNARASTAFTAHGPAGSRREGPPTATFRADAPDRLWVADLTYVRTWSGWVYAAFVVDVSSRRILGWQLTPHLRRSWHGDTGSHLGQGAGSNPARFSSIYGLAAHAHESARAALLLIEHGMVLAAVPNVRAA